LFDNDFSPQTYNLFHKFISYFSDAIAISL